MPRRGGRPAFPCSYHLFSLLLRQLRSMVGEVVFLFKKAVESAVKKFLKIFVFSLDKWRIMRYNNIRYAGE